MHHEMKGAVVKPVSDRRSRHSTWRRAIAVLACLLVAAAAKAAPKTDVIELTNGDRMTGEIKALIQGQLTLDTDTMSTVYIKWDKIRALRTNQYLQIEDINGTRHFGTAPEERLGHIAVLSDKGQQQDLPLKEIVQIYPIERGQLLDRLSGNFSLGYNYTKSSDVGTLNFGGQLQSRTDVRQWLLDGSANLTAQTGPNSTQYDFSGSYTHFLARRRYYVGRLKFEANSELGLDLRTSVAGGIGYYLKQDQRQEWAIVGALAANDEQYAGDPTRNSLDLILGTSYDFYRFEPLNTDFNFSFALIPSLTESGRIRSDANLYLRWEIVNDFYFQVSMYANYDSDPGTEANSQYDYGTTTSIGYNFD